MFYRYTNILSTCVAWKQKLPIIARRKYVHDLKVLRICLNAIKLTVLIRDLQKKPVRSKAYIPRWYSDPQNRNRVYCGGDSSVDSSLNAYLKTACLTTCICLPSNIRGQLLFGEHLYIVNGVLCHQFNEIFWKHINADELCFCCTSHAE
jgi:hypothetical protein